MRAALLVATAGVMAMAGCEAAFDIELPPIELAAPHPPGDPPEVWVRTFGGVAFDIATGVALLPGGVPVVSGFFGGSPIDYDGESIESGGAGIDAFLAQLNPDFGTFSTLRLVATQEREQASSLAPHPEGGFVTGGIFESAELDLGCDSPLVGGGVLSGFLAWHSPELGCIAQTAVVPTGAGEVAFAFLAVDDAGVVHATGRRRAAGSNDDVLFVRHDFLTNTTVDHARRLPELRISDRRASRRGRPSIP